MSGRASRCRSKGRRRLRPRDEAMSRPEAPAVLGSKPSDHSRLHDHRIPRTFQGLINQPPWRIIVGEVRHEDCRT